MTAVPNNKKTMTVTTLHCPNFTRATVGMNTATISEKRAAKKRGFTKMKKPQQIIPPQKRNVESGERPRLESMVAPRWKVHK